MRFRHGMGGLPVRFAAAALWVLGLTSAAGAATSPADFDGTPSERIEKAIAAACANGDRAVEIPAGVWLIDRAVLLPDDFTLTLRDCTVQLAPGVRDNILRNAAARLGEPCTNRNVVVRGVGRATLCGGTAPHFDPPGDRSGYRTIGVLLCGVRGFVVENLTLRETQAWGISMENGCSDGRISNIRFDDSNLMPNQDGVDVRKGCHDILIENITGRVGDDAVALTGLMRERASAAPSERMMQIGGNWPTGDDDIYNVTIRNVQCKCMGGHGIVRLLNQDGVKMYNVIVRDVVDTASGADPRAQATIRIGDTAYSGIRRSRMGEMRNVLVDGVMARGRVAVWVKGPLQDSVIRNVFLPDPATRRIDASAPMERVTVDRDPQ